MHVCLLTHPSLSTCPAVRGVWIFVIKSPSSPRSLAEVRFSALGLGLEERDVGVYIEEAVWRGSPISEVKMVRQGKARLREGGYAMGVGNFLV